MMMEMNSKVALYARVSKDDAGGDGKMQNPENQLMPLRKWAEELGYEVYKEYVDFAQGSDPNRPMIKELMNDALLKKFSLVLVWKLDRFSREPFLVVLSKIKTLTRFNVGMKSYIEFWMDTSAQSPAGELVMAVMAWAASEERNRISERTKAGLARLKAEGKLYHRPVGAKDKKPRKLSGYHVRWAKINAERRH
jgi:DNA invertase Pin-like site-specific DNA recombinase